MRCTRFYTVILLAVLVLNICKYRIPYVQYNLFEDYIAANLCVNRYAENSDCHGKCFLEKQITAVNETDENNNPAAGKKPVQPGADEYTVEKISPQPIKPSIEIQYFSFAVTCLPKTGLDIPVPPPERFV